MPAQVETMAYVGDRGLPWWVGIEDGIANEMAGLATAREAIVAGGLDWDVEFDEVQLANRRHPDGTPVISPEKRATVRSTDGAWLGTVGRNYQIIQNHEAFEFADNLVDDGQAKYETAGSLHGGRLVFLSMELNHLDLMLDGEHIESRVKTYLLLSNAHDGSRALEGDITKVRTVCKNTLNVAIKGAMHRFRVRHSGTIQGKLDAARTALGLSFTYDQAFAQAAERLMDKRLVDEQVLDILRTAVFPIDADATTEGRLETHASTKAFENYLTSPNLDPIRGTAWGAFNAVAEHVDHGTEYRGRYGSDDDIKAHSILWGTAQSKKQKAFDALLAAKPR